MTVCALFQTMAASRKRPFRWGKESDLTLLKQIAAERPTTGQMWDHVAGAVNEAHAEAGVDRRGVRDRFVKVLLPSFRTDDRAKENR